jgi:hypothetical protein
MSIVEERRAQARRQLSTPARLRAALALALAALGPLLAAHHAAIEVLLEHQRLQERAREAARQDALRGLDFYSEARRAAAEQRAQGAVEAAFSLEQRAQSELERTVLPHLEPAASERHTQRLLATDLAAIEGSRRALLTATAAASLALALAQIELARRTRRLLHPLAVLGTLLTLGGSILVLLRLQPPFEPLPFQGILLLPLAALLFAMAFRQRWRAFS